LFKLKKSRYDIGFALCYTLEKERFMNARIDRERCVGVGNCVAYAPTVFELDGENKAVVLDASSVDAVTLLKAAESCPQDAIIIMNDEGNQMYPISLMDVPNPTE